MGATAAGLYESGAQTAIKNGFELPITGFSPTGSFSSFFFKLRRPRLAGLFSLVLVVALLVLLVLLLLEVRLLFRVRLSSLETVVIINKAHPYLYIVNNIVYTVYYHVK